MKKFILILPLFILFLTFTFLLIYLLQQKDPHKPPSALLNKETPFFNTTSLFDENLIISNKDLNNKNDLINFFASWCAPCKVEHPLFFEIKKEFPELLIIGFSHKDKLEDTIKYLSEEGNPYSLVAKDFEGSVGFEFGVFGLPETFLINKEGKIIYKHIGPITKKIIFNEIKPLL